MPSRVGRGGGNQALADVRSTGTGIECLYCMSELPARRLCGGGLIISQASLSLPLCMLNRGGRGGGNQALADVRSTGAGIECLYCMSELPARRLCGGGLIISQASLSLPLCMLNRGGRGGGNQALADVRSTGAGIECLYCMSELPARRLCGGGLIISQASLSLPLCMLNRGGGGGGNQALADVRSTGAGIECLYCMSELPARRLCGGGLIISQACPSHVGHTTRHCRTSGQLVQELNACTV